MEIGERIRWLRKQRNMTIENLASKVGVTRQTISRYENGVIIDIPSSKLESIANALSVSDSYLLGLTLESQCDSAEYDIQRIRKEISEAKTDDEKDVLQANLEILQESYSDMLFLKEMQHLASTQSKDAVQNQSKDMAQKLGLRIKDKVSKFSSDKGATITMNIDSWLLLALKGMAADSGRNLADEIERALYDHVMSAIDNNSPTEDTTLL